MIVRQYFNNNNGINLETMGKVGGWECELVNGIG